jgi:hypothetical protein
VLLREVRTLILAKEVILTDSGNKTKANYAAEHMSGYVRAARRIADVLNQLFFVAV